MRLMRLILITASLVACKPAEESALQSVAAGTELQVRMATDGQISVTASDGSQVTQLVDLQTAKSSPDAGQVDLLFTSANVLIGTSRCSSMLTSGSGLLTCTSPAPAATQSPSATPGQGQPGTPQSSPPPTATAVTANDLRQTVRVRDGMHCGLHYGEKKWQVRFDVFITGTADKLDAVSTVSYDVFSAYNSGQPQVVTTRSTNFNTNVGYLTPVSGWNTGPATVRLKDGQEITLSGARIEWTNPDPVNKPTGGSCE